MAKDKDIIMLNMNKDFLADKNYDVSVLALANMQGFVDEEKHKRKIPKKDFRLHLKNVLKLTYYKIDVILDTLVGISVIEEDEEYYYLNPVTSPFLKLLVPTAKYCVTHLSAFDFKVYCYLLNKFNMHRTYNNIENYYFSCRELLSMAGYTSFNQQQMLMINQCLATLESLQLICYNHVGVGRPGKHGTYHELYAVNEVSAPQVVAANDTVRQLGGQVDEILNDILIPGVDTSFLIGDGS